MQTKIVTEMAPEDLRELITAGIVAAEQAKRESVVNPILDRLKYLTSSQAAEMIGVKQATIRTWERDGKIKSYPTGNNERFLLSEVLDIAESRADQKHKF